MAEGDRSGAAPSDVDVVVVGAGFSGLYLLHRLRALGFTTRVIDSAGDVGGTWYWNRYPGARCDIPTTDYTYSFDPELEAAWTWSEKYATQPEILSYLQFVAGRYDLRRDITFSTKVTSAIWDEAAARWLVRTDTGEETTCRFYVMASGCLSLPKAPEIDGHDRFRGGVYFTSTWPHEGVDFTGKRVAVIGTGSSGIQSIPLIAEQADRLTVFQRTANFSIPARNGSPSPERLAAIETDRAAYRGEAKGSRAGVPTEVTEIAGAWASDEVRRERFEAAWETGELMGILGVFNDILSNPVSNEIVAEMIREKIREAVEDPETAEALCPKGHPFGSKRPCLDTDYFQTYNLPHVRLVDLRTHPIVSITESGIDTTDESFEFDVIVYATGFDAMTGPVVAVDIRGRDGVSLREKWADGPSTYLGLTTVGFPNFFTITGPGSPSVLSNMAVSIEQHVDWVAGCLGDLRTRDFDTIEPTPLAEAGWNQHVDDGASITLYPTADSWYMGANVPGKPRAFLPYVAGVDSYRATCDEVVERGYLGFTLAGPAGAQCNDGVVRRLQVDVALLIKTLDELDLPPMESLPAADARALMQAIESVRPPGREVGEVVDGLLLGAEGQLAYRLYRPPTAGPHPLVAYFHGGGWVLGSLDSDDSFCRDLCLGSDAVVVSVNYRHAPEASFPAAADDAFAAVQWVAAHAAELGGMPDQLAVAGWSAGANIAAVACQLARDANGPNIVGQLLLTPVTDGAMTTASYEENGLGYVLTAPLMRWFWENYADPADRSDPKASPLRGDLANLPPAVIVTAEFDPLRDEGRAYAEGLAAAGVPVEYLEGRGQIHTSLTMTDVLPSSADLRARMGEALRGFFRAAVPA